MKKLKRLTILMLCIVVYSCELDNYDSPNAQISGGFYDLETGESIPQDIINGTKIIYEELGWDDPQKQQMVIKPDGTYQNKLMFAADYDFYFEVSNFVIPGRISSYTINKGENILDFNVQPYIRILGSEIKKVGNKIIANFIVKPTVESAVDAIGLFAHSDYAVGKELHTVSSEMTITSVLPDGGVSYTLEIDLDSDAGESLTSGKTYYFRIGARINITGAKYNYSPEVQITI